MRVYYSPLLKRYIDLDHILSVSDATFVDNMGGGGLFVTFEVRLMFSEKSIGVLRKVEYNVSGARGPVIQMIDDSWEEPEKIEDESKILAVAKMQAEIEVLVTKWCDRPRSSLGRREEETD